MTKQISEEERKKIKEAWDVFFGDWSDVEIYADGVEELAIYVGDKCCLTFCRNSKDGWETMDMYLPGTKSSEEKNVFKKDEDGNYQGRKI